jgi:hypothetical protein
MLDEAIARLKLVKTSAAHNPALKLMAEARDEVLARYQPIFSRDELPILTAADFQSFLLFKNNHHWTGLHRQGPQICQNMDGLRAALIEMHNASRPIEDRFDAALQSVNHLGKGILSAILHVIYPNEFGIWNRTSEGGLKLLEVWPDFDHGLSPGQLYRTINGVLRQLRDGLGVDLWLLDSLFWHLMQHGDAETSTESTADDAITVEEEEQPGTLQKFGLEKYLHEFLRDNWAATELGKDWEIYVEAGEDTGFKYPCGPIGQIDILARHKNGRDWLIVELKRDQSGDTTVGQLLRYMGFVRHSLAKETDRVFGLIVARSLDTKLHYAVSNLTNIAVHTYAVDFQLGPPVKSDQKLPFKLLTLGDLATTN